jgi:phage terminase small subunit
LQTAWESINRSKLQMRYMKAKGRKLTRKQRFFVAEFQKDWNATQAVVRAGYNPKNLSRASEIGYQLLQKTPVQEALQKDMDEHLRKIGVHAERTLEEVARVGFSDIRKLFNDDGSLKSPKDLDPDTAAAIAGLEMFEKFSGRGNNREIIGRTRKVKMFNKVKALELLMKYLKLFPIGDQKVDVEVHVRGVEPARLPNPELSPKILHLVKLAFKRQKEIEAQKALSGKSQDEKPKGLLK